MEQIRKLETELHQPQTRQDAARLNNLIHAGFIEIGYSGTVYSKQDIIDSLSAEPEPFYSVWSQDYQFSVLNSEWVQVIYKEARMDEQGRLSRHAIRSSIWQRAAEGWQITFHQATPVEAFTKSSLKR